MSMIRVKNLTFAYPSSEELIFDHVSFQIDTDWKLGFVGRNGRGKTTFLKLLMGELDDHGAIESQVSFAYFPYTILNPQALTSEVLEGICPHREIWQWEKELSYLDVQKDVLDRPFDTLSQGEQTKVMLAGLFLNENQFLLIDEPTNHLDTHARKVVASYLKRKKHFILVSHDRSFLDGCVDHILSLNRASIDVQSGTFSSWYTNFWQQQAFEQAQNEKLKKEISRLKQSAQRTQTWSNRIEATKIGNGPVDRGYIGHKSAKMMKRSKSIEKRQQQSIEKKSQLLKDSESMEDLKLKPLTYFAHTLVSFDKVVPVYDGKAIGEPVSFQIQKGDRVVLDGINGTGKSSLLKLITGASIAYHGKMVIGSQLIYSYVPQETGYLKGYLKHFALERQIDPGLLMAILHKMGFQALQFEKPLETYSAGQKKKVLLAASLCENAHLYIWDEPLNYIDLYSRMQIENLLLRFQPTMIFVEHDSAFQKAIANKWIHLKGGKHENHHYGL